MFIICSWSSSEFDLNEIRLIVYQDCERRGRQVLFDSKAVRKIDEAVVQVWNANFAFVLLLFCFPLQKQELPYDSVNFSILFVIFSTWFCDSCNKSVLDSKSLWTDIWYLVFLI